MSKVTDKVEALAAPVAEEIGVSIWDVEYVREAGQWFLRVYIDKEGGADINDCETFSRTLDPILDESDPIESAYVFEVSSAGLGRELRKPAHFEKMMGSEVEVRFYKPVDGAKSVIGNLSGYEGGNVTISTPQGEKTFEKAQVAQVRLTIDF